MKNIQSEKKSSNCGEKKKSSQNESDTRIEGLYHVNVPNYYQNSSLKRPRVIFSDIAIAQRFVS